MEGVSREEPWPKFLTLPAPGAERRRRGWARGGAAERPGRDPAAAGTALGADGPRTPPGRRKIRDRQAWVSVPEPTPLPPARPSPGPRSRCEHGNKPACRGQIAPFEPAPRGALISGL